MTVAGGHPHAGRRLLAFAGAAAAAGGLTYAAMGWAGQAAGLPSLRIGEPLLLASAAFVAGWHGWWRRTRPKASSGRQISKRLARAHGTGAAAYGAVLGVGVLTIVSTPAVWLGLCCCLAAGAPAWGGLYGLSFGGGRALMLIHDSLRSRAVNGPPAAVGLLVIGRQLDPRNRFWWIGTAGGLALLGLAAAAIATGPA
jgi:hypothetical protein